MINQNEDHFTLWLQCGSAFFVKRSLALWISIKTTSVSKCQHPELKAITYAPFYKPHLYFLKCQIRFFCTWLGGRIWLYWFLFSFISGTNFGRLELLIWKECRPLLFITSKLICINSTMKGLQEPWNPGKKNESILK